MPRLLAIDWDQRELSFVLANHNREQVTLEAAGNISLVGADEGAPLSAEEIGKKLQAALAPHKPARATVMVTVDRRAIELFQFTLPPAADGELPGLVLNQMSMESSSTAEDSVIDFIADPGAPSEPRRITAAALANSELKRVNSICNAAGLTPQRILLRPYAAASLFRKGRTVEEGASLLVNVIGDEVDLIIVDRLEAVFCRTVRLPGGVENEPARQRLISEIRRTILVAPQGTDVAKSIDAVFLFGIPPAFDWLLAQNSNDLPVQVEILNPFAQFQLPSDWEEQTSGRFVPLLGMLAEEARGGKHAIDFLHPRQVPKPPNRKRQLIGGALVTALLLGGGGYFLWETLSRADAENQALADQLKDLEKLVKKTAEKKKVIDAIHEWDTNAVVWLDELRDLSAKFPSGQELVLQRLSMTPARGGRASISFQGLAREPTVVSRMESTFRDARHEVQTPRVEERIQDKSYTWNFETSISIAPAKTQPEAEEVKSARSGTAQKTKATKDTPVQAAKSRKPPKKPASRAEAAPERSSQDPESSNRESPAKDSPQAEPAEDGEEGVKS